PTDALTPAAVQHIVDRARSNNLRLHLSGLLAFDSRYFLQVLEGERAGLSALFGRISADPRHRRVELLEMTAVHERRFAQWSMGFAPADAAHGELFLRFGGSPRFDPYALTAAGALGLLEAMGSVRPS
ncbi:MAG: Blue light- and temperature-regulated antirepressor YcgF, partial [Pseudomonadota bacterium]